MTPPSRLVQRPKVGEKSADRFPDLRTARYAVPMPADQSDERVAAVDRHRVVFSGTVGPVDQQSFYIGLKFGERRVVGNDSGPCVEREKRLGGTCGTGIEGENAFFRGAVEEERELDRNAECVPF